MEKGDEEGFCQRQQEVKDFWDKVEQDQIKPILDTYDEETRAILEKALYLRRDEAATDGAKDQSLLAQPGIPTSETANLQTESERPAEPRNVPGTENKHEVEEDRSETLAQPAGDQYANTEDSRKTTPISEVIKIFRNAYVAAKKAYRIHPSRLQRVREALSLFEGTRNYHNYTVQKSFADPSAKRVIKSFVVTPNPILINGTEWLSLKVHGQSFMMHQIRKMVGMVALMVRCGSDLKRIAESYGPEKISIPKAPSLGLLLERPVFDSYNKRAKANLGREPIDFGRFTKEMDEFKQREIYERIYCDEEKDNM